MGYPRWLPIETTTRSGQTIWLVGECTDGEREYREVERFATASEAWQYIGRRRTDEHTARTMRSRRKRTSR